MILAIVAEIVKTIVESPHKTSPLVMYLAIY